MREQTAIDLGVLPGPPATEPEPEIRQGEPSREPKPGPQTPPVREPKTVPDAPPVRDPKPAPNPGAPQRDPNPVSDPPAPARDPPPMPDMPPVREPGPTPDLPPGRDPNPMPDRPPGPDPVPEPTLPPPDPDPAPSPARSPIGGTPASSALRVPELDGLRGAAIVLVMMGHYFVTLPGEPPVVWTLGSWFRMGWSGVDLFFVLSGFLIGGILLKSRDSPGYFRSFYTRRFFRIIPLYYLWTALYAMVAVAAIAVWHARASVSFVELPGWQLVAQLFFLQTFAGHYQSLLAGRWFVPSWSLAVEEQFYLLAPLCVRRLSRRALAALLGGVVIAAPLVRTLLLHGNTASPWSVYILLPCRADALAVGVLAALAWSDAKCRAWLRAHVYLLYAALGALYLGMRHLYLWHSDPLLAPAETAGLSWIAAFYGVLLLVLVAHPAGVLAWAARRSWLRELGRVSYAMYLMHLAVLTCIDLALRHGLPNLVYWRDGVAAVVAAACTYALARASWAWLEQPMLSHGRRYGSERSSIAPRRGAGALVDRQEGPGEERFLAAT